MIRTKLPRRMLLAVSLSLVVVSAGCNLSVDEFLDELEDLEIDIGSIVSVIQGNDPRVIDLPSSVVDRGHDVFIDADVTFVDDISSDLVYTELPNVTLLGFENLTGYDMYLEYYVDDQFQSAWILAGETVLLEYDCLYLVELYLEEDYDPFTGEYWDAYDLSGFYWENPYEFECGDALIISIDPFGVSASLELVALQ